MKLKTTLNGSSFAFRDIKDVLAKANVPKSADRFQGIAAATATENSARRDSEMLNTCRLASGAPRRRAANSAAGQSAVSKKTPSSSVI